MKCICEYERFFDFDRDKWIGDKEFIFIQKVIIKIDIFEEAFRSIYACPKCGTLKIDI